METKIVKLKNLYTGDIIHTEKYSDVKPSDGINFIEAFNPDNPYRKFLVNRDAYTIIHNK